MKFIDRIDLEFLFVFVPALLLIWVVSVPPRKPIPTSVMFSHKIIASVLIAALFIVGRAIWQGSIRECLLYVLSNSVIALLLISIAASLGYVAIFGF